MLRFSKYNFLWISKIGKRWCSNTLCRCTLTIEEEEAIELPFAAIKEDKNMLILKGNASTKLLDLDKHFYIQALDCYSRAAELEGTSIRERIGLC